MKKGFGWFFIVLGVLNIIRGFIMFSEGTYNAGGILIFGILILVLGAWMATSNKPKEGVRNEESPSPESKEPQSV